MTAPNDVAALVERLVAEIRAADCASDGETILAATIAALQAEVERANEALDTIARGRIGPVSCLGAALAAMQSFAREACRLPAARSASRKENTP